MDERIVNLKISSVKVNGTAIDSVVVLRGDVSTRLDKRACYALESDLKFASMGRRLATLDRLAQILVPPTIVKSHVQPAEVTDRQEKASYRNGKNLFREKITSQRSLSLINISIENTQGILCILLLHI